MNVHTALRGRAAILSSSSTTACPAWSTIPPAKFLPTSVCIGSSALLGEDTIQHATEMAKTAIGFKLYMGNTFGAIPSPDTGAMLEAFEVVAPTGKRVSLHAETNEIMVRRELRMREAGRTDPLAHIASRPAVVAVDIAMAYLDRESPLYAGVEEVVASAARVITVARAGPIAEMSAKNTTNAIAVQTSPRTAIDHQPLACTWVGGRSAAYGR